MTPEERQADWQRRRDAKLAEEKAKRAESDARYEAQRAFADKAERAGAGGALQLSDGSLVYVGEVNGQGGCCDD